MIKIFRHIRKNLLNEGKTTNYLKYAIGEIALVMIGILLALQVNNWNESRKDNKFEIKMLEEVIHALESDIDLLNNGIKPRLTNKQESIDNLLELIALGEKEQDSIIMYHYDRMKVNGRMTFNYGPYESLKVNGLEKIKIDSIRVLLVRIYENFFPRQTEFYHSYENRDENLINSMEKELFKNVIINPANKDRAIKRIPKSGDFLQNPILLEIIRMEQKDAGHKKYRLEGTIETANKLYVSLNNYLNDLM